MKNLLKKYAVALLAVTLLSTLALAQGGMAKKPAAAGSSASEELRQMERDWTDAQKAGDADKIGQLLSDHWSAFGPDGKKMNKQAYLADFKSGANKFESGELGPMDVLVIGNVGIVQGSDTEKSSYKGKDTSGKYVWMDVFQKKDGKWQAVRSEVTKVS
jgi:ketosteroid isomerase-like protein